jgi:hypothetical protein
MSGNLFDHYGVPGEAVATPQRDWSDVPGEAWRDAPRGGAARALMAANERLAAGRR